MNKRCGRPRFSTSAVLLAMEEAKVDNIMRVRWSVVANAVHPYWRVALFENTIECLLRLVGKVTAEAITHVQAHTIESAPNHQAFDVLCK